MQFYIQTNNEGYITDCITYEYPDYIPVNFDLPLPGMLLAGCYRYLGNDKYELDESKKSVEPALSTLEAKVNILMAVVAAIMPDDAPEEVLIDLNAALVAAGKVVIDKVPLKVRGEVEAATGEAAK